MKISPVQINNFKYFSNNKNTSNPVKSQNNIVNNEKALINNSISALIGKSQVSFSGINKNTGSVFEHDCSDLIGHKEHIQYDKETGSFVHIVFNRDGSVKQQEEYYPQDNKEIITRQKGNLTEVITKIGNSGVRKEVFDESGRNTYLSVIDKRTGNSKIVETDYEKQREITTEVYNGRRTVRIINIATAQRVFTGPLAEERKYDKQTGTYITRNIISGQVLKIEKYNSIGDLVSQKEYYEGSDNILSRHFWYDSREGECYDEVFDKDGSRKSLVITAKKGNEKCEIEYSKDGMTEKSRIFYEYDKYGKEIRKTVYVPGTATIKERTEHSPNENNIYYYKERPNVPEYAQTYVDDVLVREVSYYNDGKSIQHIRIYNPDKSYDEHFYTKEGIKNKTKLYTADNYLYAVCEYDNKTGEKIKSIEVLQGTNDILETLYDRSTGNVKRISLIDENKNIKETTVFYEDGHTPKYKNVYNKDGSYLKTRFDELGNPVSTIEYNADGTVKRPKEKQQRNTDSSSKNDDEFILDISNIVGKKDGISEITDAQCVRLAKILGLDSASDVKSMGKNTYRNLVKKYNQNHVIFQIINALYHSPTNDKKGI